MSHDRFGLLYHRSLLHQDPSYLGRDNFQGSMAWKRSAWSDLLCIGGSSDSTDPAVPALLSLVAVPSSRDWHNKLAGLGDFNEQYPREFTALKWLLHLAKPSDTVFMSDWDVAMSRLQDVQRLIQKVPPSDMIITDKGRIVELRTTAKMFKKSVSVHHYLTYYNRTHVATGRRPCRRCIFSIRGSTCSEKGIC